MKKSVKPERTRVKYEKENLQELDLPVVLMTQIPSITMPEVPRKTKYQEQHC